MDNSRLKTQAKTALEGRWGLAVGTYFVYLLITTPQSVPKVGVVFALLLSGAMSVGFSRFGLNVAENADPQLNDLFFGFKQYGRSWVTMFLTGIYVILWALLLIIPGIIAAYSYSQVSFILADDENIGAEAAMAKSKQMMDGYKMDLFILHLSFIGWFLLCILTLGIGFLWLGPWAHVTMANFYLEVKANWEYKYGAASLPDAPVVG